MLANYLSHMIKHVRDERLLDVPKRAKFILFRGKAENMYQINQLDTVRRMELETWGVIIVGDNKGMVMKIKAGTTFLSSKTGKIIAGGLQTDNFNGGQKRRNPWNEETEQAEWSGWRENGRIGA